MKAATGSIGFLLLVLLALTGASAGAAAADTHYTVGPVPAWAQSRTPDYRATIDPKLVSGGTYYLLYDRDSRVLPRGDIFHAHMAVRLMSAAGIDDYSQLNFDVDPSYQKLTLNYVRVVRDGKVMDQIGRARITELAQENELDLQLYNGGYTVNLLLEDLRPNDVVEYEYTIESHSELFPEHFYAWLQTRWADPVLTQRVRILNESGRKLEHRSPHELAEPTVRQVASGELLEWNWKNLPAMASDSDLPSWYSAWPALEISDLANWKSVVDLLRPLYEGQVREDGTPKARAVRIESQDADPGKRVLAAAHFVQDEIRYAGIEIGPGSHRPTDPEVVLKRRFGDCKDKTLVLISMLRSMGYDAVPALVNTDDRQTLFEHLPSPYAFDHVIALLRLKGKSYWIDGTLSHEHGDLTTLEYSDLKAALILDANSRSLQRIPSEPVDAARKVIASTVDLRGGLEKPAKFDITTTYAGEYTAAIRRNFESSSRERTARSYLNYYAKHYPTVHTLHAPEMTDDTDRNEVRVVEQYRIDRPAERNTSKGETSVTVHADEIYPFVNLPDTRIRSSPIAVTYPASIVQTIDVLLPEEWNLDPVDTDIRNDIFHYHSSVRYEPKDRRARVKYEYQAFADTVPVNYIDRYYRDVNRMNDDLDYSFILTTGAAAEGDEEESSAPVAKTAPTKAKPPTPAYAGIAPVPMLAILIALGFSAWLVRRLYRYDPPPRDDDLPANIRSGFGGWLTLPTFGLIVSLPMLLFTLWKLGSFLDMNQWVAMGAGAKGLHHQTHVITFLALLIPQIAMGGTLLLLCIKRRTSAPAVWLIFLAASVVVSVFTQVNGALAGIDEIKPSDVVAMVRTAAVSGLWMLYFVKSNRVKATFVRRLKPAPNAGMQESAVPI